MLMGPSVIHFLVSCVSGMLTFVVGPVAAVQIRPSG